MLPQLIFPAQLVLGYVACLLCFSVYALPKLKLMSRFDAQRAIATLHSFRFFGLVFILPGVVGLAQSYLRALLLRLPPMATLQLECWPSWRCSR